MRLKKAEHQLTQSAAAELQSGVKLARPAPLKEISVFWISVALNKRCERRSNAKSAALRYCFFFSLFFPKEVEQSAAELGAGSREQGLVWQTIIIQQR